MSDQNLKNKPVFGIEEYPANFQKMSHDEIEKMQEKWDKVNAELKRIRKTRVLSAQDAHFLNGLNNVLDSIGSHVDELITDHKHSTKAEN